MIANNKCSLLEQLISRGDHIDIVKGKLNVESASNKPIPKSWLNKHSDNLIIQIAELVNVFPYVYTSYSTGNYGEHRSGGISLQFINLVTGEDAHAVFNAELTRARKSKSGDKGIALPKGQFRVREGHQFYKFWRLTGLNIPPRLSVFHQYMGNLKGSLFLPTLGTKDKFINKKTTLMNVSYEQILNELNGIETYNSQTRHEQQTYNTQTTMTNNETNQTYVNKGLYKGSSTCAIKYGLSNKGSAYKGNAIPVINTIKTPNEQTHEEWLRDWDNA